MPNGSVFVVLLAAALPAQNAAGPFDPAIFKSPPAEYRGHAMWNFNLVLRGAKSLRIWNPHTGGQEATEITAGDVNGQPVTTVRLRLPSVASLFFITDQEPR